MNQSENMANSVSILLYVVLYTNLELSSQFAFSHLVIQNNFGPLSSISINFTMQQWL
jgi:hypothetical protein